MRALGFDTSNYTTSVAEFHGVGGENCSRLLDVKPGELGLRQSDALFAHVRRLPELVDALCGKLPADTVRAVGASTRPRAVEGSYMPCFLAGESVARSAAHLLSVPLFTVSHQQGHIAAAALSAGKLDLLDGEFLAWHLSGGTSELLHVKCGADGLPDCTCIGGTTDLAAGQYHCPILCAGGVMASQIIRARMNKRFGGEVSFAEPTLSGDNAVGVAVLAAKLCNR